jgi:hypothetical protein
LPARRGIDVPPVYSIPFIERGRPVDQGGPGSNTPSPDAVLEHGNVEVQQEAKWNAAQTETG